VCLWLSEVVWSSANSIQHSALCIVGTLVANAKKGCMYWLRPWTTNYCQWLNFNILSVYQKQLSDWSDLSWMWCLLHLTDFYGGSLEKSISLKDIRSSSDQEQLARVSYIDGCLITTQRIVLYSLWNYLAAIACLLSHVQSANNWWPLANFQPFLWNGQSKFQRGAFTLYTCPNQIHEEWSTISSFFILHSTRVHVCFFLSVTKILP